ncbi:MAG: transposase [Acidobacteriota bacterium]|nr:transposase [Acidobacteriota bacterium]
MKFDVPQHQRRSIRLQGYDYSQPGFYYLTICVEGKRPILGRIDERGIELSNAGKIALREWKLLLNRFCAIRLDAFVVMPNHVHAIIQIEAAVGAGAAQIRAQQGSWAQQAAPLRRPALSEVVRAFKSSSAVAINKRLGTSGPIWQRSYYERVIRNEQELFNVREYIAQNPSRWAADGENPSAGPEAELEMPWQL